MTSKLKIYFSLFAIVIFITILNSCGNGTRKQTGKSSNTKKDSATIMAMGKDVFSRQQPMMHGILPARFSSIARATVGETLILEWLRF